jgi:E3 ubiquitin-protein ligase RNF25
MLYDVIEKCRELLTSFNFPIGNICAICLYEFTTNDQIVKNECFHHLHSRCLADYFISIEKSLKQTEQIERNNGNKSLQTSSDVIVYCPVCRNNLDISHLINNMDPNKYAVPYLSNEPLKDEIIIIEEAKQNVKKFNQIYLKQLQNGGIIDAEAEKNKFFIRISQENNETTTS